MLRTASYAVSCILAASILVVSGFAYYVKAQVTSIGGSNAISGGPVSGAMNILLMGLESRTDYDGNILPAKLLKALHAGSVQGVENGVGGQDTNTLILIHIFAGGQRAVGFSIPRDDWVTYPKPYDGQSHGKIDQAYGLAWAQSLSSTSNSTISKNQRYLEANEAGQTAAIDSVQALTGVHVDHFAEVNLAGFYELAQTFGGVEACLKSWNGGQNLHDTNSGFDAPHAGYLHLSAAPGAGLRPRAGQPAQRRPGPYPPAAGRHRLRHLEARAPRLLHQHRRPHQPGQRGEKVHHHRLGLADPQLRHRDEEPDRKEPDLPDRPGDHHGRP